MSLESLENIDIKKLIIQINKEKGKDNMIPTDRISEYLKKEKTGGDEEEHIEDDETIIEDTKVPGAIPTVNVPTTDTEILEYDMEELDSRIKNMTLAGFNALRKGAGLDPIDDIVFDDYMKSLRNIYYERPIENEQYADENKLVLKVLVPFVKRISDWKRGQMDPKSVL